MQERNYIGSAHLSTSGCPIKDTTMSGRIALIGSQGYLGSHVSAALGHAGCRVVGINRRWHGAPHDQPAIAADMTQPALTEAALFGIDTVINCAAGPPLTHTAIAMNLRNWRDAAPGRALVHVSTLAVFAGHGGVVTEATAPQAHRLRGYAMAKLQTERLLTARDAMGDTLIIRPGCIYGPGSKPWVDRIARLIRAGRLGDLGKLGAGVCPLIHVRDLADIIAEAAMRPLPGLRIQHAVTAEPPSWNAYFRVLGGLIGVEQPPRINAMTLAAEAWLRHPAARILRRTGTDTISPSMRSLFRDQTVYAAPASIPSTPLLNGLAEAAAAFLAAVPTSPAPA